MANIWGRLAKALPATVDSYYKGRKTAMDEDKSALEQLYKQKESERLAKAAGLDEIFKTHSMKNADARLGLDQQKVAPVSTADLFQRDPEAAKALGAFAGPNNMLDREVYDTYVKTRLGKTPEEIAQIKANTGKTVADTNKTVGETGETPAEAARKQAETQTYIDRAALYREQAKALATTSPAQAKKLEAEAAREESKAKQIQSRPVASPIAKLSDTAKTKVGGIASTLRSLTEYNAAYDAGSRPTAIDANTPLLGKAMSDTPVTVAARKISDDIGRLRSGGAINGDEEKRFLGMLPRMNDRPEIAKQKLAQLRQEMLDRLAPFGVNESNIAAFGYNPAELGFGGPSKPPAGGETKTVGGKQYRKVPGGWQEI